jgi:hypothetical protein
MSHISTYAVRVSDIDLFCRIAKDMGHEVNFHSLAEQTVQFFGSNAVKAIASISIDGWRYPIAINKDGEISYDHWGSKPNTMEKLGQLLQKYSTDLIINNMPMDVVKSYYGEQVDRTGEYKLVLEYE